MSFCADRLPPARPRRSAPGPGASSLASSVTFFFYPRSTARERNTDTGQRPHEDTHSLYASPPPPLRDRGAIVVAAPQFVRLAARRSHLTSYDAHIRTPRSSVARLRPSIASPPRTRELSQRACEVAKGGLTRGSPTRYMFLLEVG